MDPAIYFGRAGSLAKLYDPTGGLLSTREIGTNTFLTGSGGARVERALNGTRQFVLSYGALGKKNFDFLDQFRQGHMGTGPFVFLDPGRRNLLTVNQSASTSATNDTRDFTVSGTGGSITSDATLTTPFPRTLKWSFATSTPATASLLLDKPSSVWPGVPIVNRPYTFWCMVIGGPVNFQLTLKWMDLAGATISTSTSSMFTSSATNWLMVSLRALTVPATAQWVQAGIAPDVSTIAAGESLFFTSFMLHEGSVADDAWSPGTGVYPVQVVTLPERQGFAEPSMLVSPTLVLQEVR